MITDWYEVAAYSAIIIWVLVTITLVTSVYVEGKLKAVSAVLLKCVRLQQKQERTILSLAERHNATQELIKKKEQKNESNDI